MRKIISKILLVLAIMVVCFGCSNETGFKDYKNYLNDSMKSVTNITTNIKSPIIFAIHAIATVVRGVFESPSPLNTPPITLYATIKNQARG